MRLTIFSLCILGLALAARADAPPKRDPAHVADDVLSNLGNTRDLEEGRRTEWAGKGDKQEADYLLALSKQLLTDELHGRWVNDKYYSGVQAGYMRQNIAHALGDAANSDVCLDLVLWFIDHDTVHDNVTAVAPALARIKAAGTAEILGKLIDHPNDAVAVTAIQQAGARHIEALAPAVAALSGIYRTPLREAARAQADALHFTPRDYTPEKAFTPWLEEQLRSIRNLVSAPIPDKAPWQHFILTDSNVMIDGKPQQTDFGGWLIGQTHDTYHVVDWCGVERTLAKADTKILERSLQAEAAALVAAATQQGDSGQRFPTMNDPRLIARFMVGAWPQQKGAKTAAADLLFPILLASSDQRDAIAHIRDGVAQRYRTAMLEKFGVQRDYAEAARLAKHLSGPAFNGWALQAQTRELAAQLSQRQEDFVTLKLPSAGDWARLQSTLTRAQQVNYLAGRLRLMFAPQPYWGWGGFEMEQYAQPLSKLTFAAAMQPAQVINPYRELKAMKLSVSELPLLLPSLLDNSFMLACENDFSSRERPTSLPRVDQAAAALVNAAAGRTLVDFRYLESLERSDRQAYIKTITAWVDDHALLSRADLLKDSLRTAATQGDFFIAAQDLAVLKDKDAAPIIIRRFDDFSQSPQEKSSVAMLLYHLDPQAAAASARQWLKSNDYHLKFWAAMILVHAGDTEKGEGWPELLAVLQAHNNNQYVPHAFDTLLASQRKDARAFALSVLKNAELMHWDGASYVHRLLLAGYKDAFDYELALLDDHTDAGGGFTRGDNAAAQICRWHAEKYEYNEKMTAEERAAERAKAALWLREQFALIQAGKPSHLKNPESPPLSVQWNFPPSH